MNIEEILFMLIIIGFLGQSFILRDVLGVLRLHLSSREGTGAQGNLSCCDARVGRSGRKHVWFVSTVPRKVQESS